MLHILAPIISVAALTVVVKNDADLQQAIKYANITIDVQANITLSATLTLPEFSRTTIFSSNGAWLSGGNMRSIFVSSDNPSTMTKTMTMINLTLTDGLADDHHWSHGGGAVRVGEINFTAVNVIFRNNHAIGPNGIGGAVWCDTLYTGLCVFNGCHFISNSAISRGGAVGFYNGHGIFTDCYFVDNWSNNNSDYISTKYGYCSTNCSGASTPMTPDQCGGVGCGVNCPP
eukprot:7173361-Prymnesium_polylepis.1